MIDYNHPAVKAAQIGALGRPHYTLDAYASALTAALPHLTADDLRHTPAGRALMAEGWEEGVRQFAQHGDVDRNPYREETPNE